MGGNPRKEEKGLTLYVSDLDGTLLQPGGYVSAASRDLLNVAIGSGALFTVATARTPATVSTLLEGIDMRLPAVVMTGAALWDSRSGDYSDISTIPEQTVADMMTLYRRHGLATFVYRLIDNRIHIYHSGELSRQEEAFLAERIGSPYKHYERVAVEADGMPAQLSDVLLFYAMQPDELVEGVYSRLREMPVTPLMYHDLFGPETAILEVFGPQTSKAAAVRRLADSVGATRIVAFGDNLNDLPLLRMADVGVAVGNAVEEVRQQADLVIEENTADAVARFISADMAAES